MLNQISLAAVRAFESAARHGSFRSAAVELNVSPSAVSHSILKLEQTLGIKLFERDGRVARLSPDGEILMRHTKLAFEELRLGLEIVSARGPQLLRVHCAPSFAAQWLSPRLPSFFARYPNLDVRLAASTDYSRFTGEDFDLDIVYGTPRVQGLVIIPLGKEQVTPLCAPALAATICKPEDLLKQVLIQSDVKTVQWHAWFDINGLGLPSQRGMRFDRSFLALAAASDGLGVALESLRLAERELKSGRLAAPLRDIAKDISYVAHYLVLPQSTRRRRSVTTFVNWLLAELELDESLPEET